MDKTAIDLIEKFLDENGIENTNPFVDRCIRGFESYMRDDGTHNHLAADFDTTIEAIQEAIDGVNITTFAERRGEMNERQKLARRYFVEAYHELLIDLLERGLDEGVI